jgi:hypothetical protein
MLIGSRQKTAASAGCDSANARRRTGRDQHRDDRHAQGERSEVRRVGPARTPEGLEREEVEGEEGDEPGNGARGPGRSTSRLGDDATVHASILRLGELTLGEGPMVAYRRRVDLDEALRQLRDLELRTASQDERSELTDEGIADLERALQTVDDPVERERHQAAVNQMKINAGIQRELRRVAADRRDAAGGDRRAGDATSSA